MFQLALCLGSLEIPEEFRQEFKNDSSEDDDGDDSDREDEDVGTQRTDGRQKSVILKQTCHINIAILSHDRSRAGFPNLLTRDPMSRY